jgi:hypothetical protein
MTNDHRPNGSDDDETARSRALVAAGVIVLLLVVGLVLARVLWSSAKLQDCVMSGRTNCAPIETR